MASSSQSLVIVPLYDTLGNVTFIILKLVGAYSDYELFLERLLVKQNPDRELTKWKSGPNAAEFIVNHAELSAVVVGKENLPSVRIMHDDRLKLIIIELYCGWLI